MKTQTFMVLCLLVTSIVVLIGLILGRNVWGGIVCYWTFLSLKNLLDWLDRRQKHGK